LYSGSAGVGKEAVGQTILETSRNFGSFEDQVVDKVLVAAMGLGGGSFGVYGRQKDGIWSFWREGCSMADLDEDGNDIWTSWVSEPVPELSLAVPSGWPLYYPQEIDHAFLNWFRNNYDNACSQLVETHQNYQWKSKYRKWMRVLYGKTDDDLDFT
jgi:hypothetical protein